MAEIEILGDSVHFLGFKVADLHPDCPASIADKFRDLLTACDLSAEEIDAFRYWWDQAQ